MSHRHHPLRQQRAELAAGAFNPAMIGRAASSSPSAEDNKAERTMDALRKAESLGRKT
ncbi:hypothetical protein ROLI_015210 [Roseobacter fucihabitans]|uniref:Uncharacterized protein n=1 Tax=Roseobacter fucihabitans TaxID=1537242 RepID=A0ABZ2BRG5_9RHOB|nr:hypothetical protein [Roseobacter litoralis]MBC6965436.1 hypothetical protein [Roseobacter litoralis]